MSLVGFRARNHPQQARRDDVDDRRTPREFFERLHAAHRFTIDAAASAENAMLPDYWTREQDAFAQEWGGHRVWCNPPYSEVAAWVEKAWLAMRFEDCALVVMLLPANRTEQKWWQWHIEPWRDRDVLVDGIRLTTEFLKGRMRFEHPADHVTPEKGDRPPFGLVLVTWERAA